MSEVFRCPECQKRVDLKADEYEVLNRATARYKWQLVYAHTQCVRTPGGLSGLVARLNEMSDSEVEQETQKRLADQFLAMSDEELRRFGLQRIMPFPRS